MGWDKLADLASGVWDRFFSRKAKEEGRVNEIDRLEREQKDLAKANIDGRYDNRLVAIAERLSKLYSEAKNSRAS